MSQTKVSYKRHLAKTISYRILSTTIGFLIMWIVSGSIQIGAAFGAVELLYKPLQYYIHERIWYRYIKFGLIEDKKKSKQKSTVEEISPEIIVEKEMKNQPKGKKVLNYSSNR